MPLASIDNINTLVDYGVNTKELLSSLDDTQKQLLLALLNEKASRKGLTNTTRYHFALERHQTHKYKKLDFKNRHYLKEIYEDESSHIVIKKAVQVGISEWAIIDALYMCLERNWSGAYILTKSKLRDDFVSERINTVLGSVPYYKTKVGKTDNLGIKQLGKGMLRFLGSNATDDFISFPADFIIVDEVDRCDTSNLALARDRLQASDFKFERWISNPTVEGMGIDAMYAESDQKRYIIPCGSCKKFTELNWFEHIVEECSGGMYQLRDREFIDGISKKIRAYCSYCHKELNRFAQGNWIRGAEHSVSGYTLSQLYSPTVTLEEMYKDFVEGMFNETKSQIFWNNRLGLAYKAKGAKITLDLLRQCERSYVMPYEYEGKNSVYMGVDVGTLLHVVIRESVSEKERKLLFVGTVRGFDDLPVLFARYNVECCVIDRYPETRKVTEFQNEYPDTVWTADYYLHNASDPIALNRDGHSIRADRTVALDGIMEDMKKRWLIMPTNVEHINNGEYLRHLESTTRIHLPEKEKFTYVHSGDDHYLHAEVYCKFAEQCEGNPSVYTGFSDEPKEVDNGDDKLLSDIVRIGSFNPLYAFLND